jgi:RimJ/RimL family protein N-acetyltransferase
MAAFDRDMVVARLISGPWAKSSLASPGDALCLGVELAATGTLIGDVMLMWHSEKLRHGEIGYVLHPEYAGTGYMTEAAHALLHLAFDQLDLHRVTAGIVPANRSSTGLAERLGMRAEAHHVESILVGGDWSDQLVYAILEGEWQAQDHRPGRGGCGAA